MTRRAASLILTASLRAIGQVPAPLRLVRSIPLPNIEGRMGDPGIDLAGQRLFVPAFSAGLVVIAHLESGKLLPPLTGVKSPQAVLHVAERNMLVIASRDDGVKVMDAASGRAVASVKAPYAERLRYHALSKSILATHANGVLILDLNGKVLGDVRMESRPQALETETSTTRFFVADTVRKTIVVADSSSRSIKSLWPVQSEATTYCMAYDNANKRLFLAGRRPSRIATLDAFSGITIDQRDTVAEASAAFHDGAGGRVLILGNGEIDVVRQLTPDRYDPLARLATRKGTRAGLYIPELNRLVVAASQTGSEPAALLVYELSR